MKARLEKHYHEWGAKAPWEHEETSMMKTLSEKLKKLSKEKLAKEKAAREMRSLMTLAGVSSTAALQGTLLAWKNSHDQFETLSKRVARSIPARAGEPSTPRVVECTKAVSRAFMKS